MNQYTHIQKLRRIGVFFTIALIALGVIIAAYLVYILFDYRINDSMIAAAIAGASLIYEVRKSKKLNEAEFLIHLNSLFITNSDYKKIYDLLSNYNFDIEPNFDSNPDLESKEKLEKEISNCDISNYLTLFETFYILLKRKVIDIKLLDDLFAYRFFLAVHNPYIQRKKLAISPKNFKNIYRLEYMWLQYRKSVGAKDNYFSESYHLINRTDPELYLSVFSNRIQKQIIKQQSITKLEEQSKYRFVNINDKKYFEDINKLQSEAVEETKLVKKGMLRANTKTMLQSCLGEPHQSIGIKYENELIGFGVLYDPSKVADESIKKEIKKDKRITLIEDDKIMHIKLIVISKKHRKQHLQYHMNKYLEKIAADKGKTLLLTTVSPFNIASVKNTVKSGFTYQTTVNKYAGAVRLVYAKHI